MDGTTRDSNSSKAGRQQCCRRMAGAELRRWSGFGFMIRSFAKRNVRRRNVDGRRTSRTPPLSSIGSEGPYEISSQNSTDRRQRRAKSRAYCPLRPSKLLEEVRFPVWAPQKTNSAETLLKLVQKWLPQAAALKGWVEFRRRAREKETPAWTSKLYNSHSRS